MPLPKWQVSLPKKIFRTPKGRVTTPYQHIMLQNINSHPKTDIKHHFPVSVGITVQKELNNRLALETGLVYTYLSSDLTAGGAAYYTQNQQLHYLGIPLKLNWNFLKKRYFNLYLSGGGMLEKCVHGELSAQYEMNNRPPFSNDETLHIKPIAVVRIGIGRNLFQTGVAYKPLCRAWYCLLLRRWIGHFDHS